MPKQLPAQVIKIVRVGAAMVIATLVFIVLETILCVTTIMVATVVQSVFRETVLAVSVSPQAADFPLVPHTKIPGGAEMVIATLAPIVLVIILCAITDMVVPVAKSVFLEFALGENARRLVLVLLALYILPLVLPVITELLITTTVVAASTLAPPTTIPLVVLYVALVLPAVLPALIVPPVINGLPITITATVVPMPERPMPMRLAVLCVVNRITAVVQPVANVVMVHV